MAWSHTTNQHYFATSGVIDVMVAVLQRYHDDRDVQSEGCRAIDNLCWNNKGMVDKMGQGGAIQVVVNALAGFPKSKSLQLQGIRAGKAVVL